MALPVAPAGGEPAKRDLRDLKARWEAYLGDKRLNTTAQREAIVEQFFRAPEHISIEELLNRVRRRHPKVGYATVYRTLKLLVDAALASERQFGDGQARYEVAGEHHDPALPRVPQRLFGVGGTSWLAPRAGEGRDRVPPPGGRGPPGARAVGGLTQNVRLPEKSP